MYEVLGGGLSWVTNLCEESILRDDPVSIAPYIPAMTHLKTR